MGFAEIRGITDFVRNSNPVGSNCILLEKLLLKLFFSNFLLVILYFKTAMEKGDREVSQVESSKVKSVTVSMAVIRSKIIYE